METWNDKGKSTRRTRPMAEVAGERRRNAKPKKHEDVETRSREETRTRETDGNRRRMTDRNLGKGKTRPSKSRHELKLGGVI
jgi:hypothetical protein